jgi:glutamate-5-semialdehyde dehydrogenase
VILKGGKEAHNSNLCLFQSIQTAIKIAACGISPDAVQLVSNREEISTLLKCCEYIDLVIPRGSNALVKHIKENTTIPVLGFI